MDDGAFSEIFSKDCSIILDEDIDKFSLVSIVSEGESVMEDFSLAMINSFILYTKIKKVLTILINL